MLILELTDAQATALATVLANVGGAPEGTRGQIDRIIDSLFDSGFEPDLELLDDTMPHRVTFLGPNGEQTPKETRELIDYIVMETLKLPKEN